MAVRNVIIWPDSRLAEPSLPVEPSELGGDALKALVQDLVDTAAALRGVGLAAPQIGVKKRVVIIPGTNNEPLALINPVLSDPSPETQKGNEGCLSLPGVSMLKERPKSVHLKALNLKGEPFEVQVEGLESVAIQHEVEHLDGKTIADGVSMLKRDLLKTKITKTLRQMKRDAERRRLAEEDRKKDYAMKAKKQAQPDPA